MWPGGYRSHLATVRALTAPLGRSWWFPNYIALLPRVCELAGQIEETATLADEALRTV
jgi:hypothetical protein